MSLPEFHAKLLGASSLLLIPHKNPDGDAIGSSLGLMHYLHEKGLKASILVQDAIPHFLHFLPGSSDIQIYESDPAAAATRVAQADMILCMDYSQLLRCGELESHVRSSSAFVAAFDHHPFPEPGLGFYWHEIGASSTSELVYEYIRHADPGHVISLATATCLYSGILTDTGCFKYALRPETFAAASGLLAAGIHTEHITTQIFDMNTPARIKLLGFTLNEKLTILPEYRTAYISLTYNELAKYHLQKGDTEGLVNYTLSIQNMAFGAFFHEREPGKTRISLRSKGSFAVNEVSAKYFGGGGHRNAAGGQWEGPVNEAVARFREILPHYKDDLQRLHIG